MEIERTRFYKVGAVADAFDVHRSTIYRAIESGSLEALRIGSGRGSVRIPGWSLLAYRNATQPASEAPTAPAALA